MADISVQARTRSNVLLCTLDVHQILRQDSGEQEGIRNVEQQNHFILKDGKRPSRFLFVIGGEQGHQKSLPRNRLSCNERRVRPTSVSIILR